MIINPHFWRTACGFDAVAQGRRDGPGGGDDRILADFLDRAFDFDGLVAPLAWRQGQVV